MSNDDDSIVSNLKENKAVIISAGIVTLMVGAYVALTTIVGPPSFANTTTDDTEKKTEYAAVMMMEENSAVIFELKYSNANVGIYELVLKDGSRINVDKEHVVFIKGEDAHTKAEIIAQGLVGEDGEVTCYNREEGHSKVLVKTNKSDKEF